MDQERDRPTALRSSQVFAGIAVITLAVFAGMVVAYFKLIRYERVAAYHVPKSATFAARVDLEKVILYEPLRKHLLPLLSGVSPETEEAIGQSHEPTRLSRIEKKTGIKLGMDIRELLIATGSKPDEWVLVMGGLFPRTGVIKEIYDALTEEGKLAVSLSADGRELTLGALDIHLAQADDGALLAAPSAEQLHAALPQQTAFASLGLSREGAGSFGLNDRFAAHLLGSEAESRWANASDRVARAFGDAHLGSSTEMHVTIELQATDAAHLQEQANALVDTLRKLAASAAGADFAGERALLPRAATAVKAPNQVILTAIWERSEMDRGAENLAEWLRGHLGDHPPNSR